MVSWQPKMISSRTRRRSAQANVPAFRTAGALRFRERRPALGAGIPTAPAYAGETLKIGCDRPPGLALVCRNASLGYRDFSLQLGDGFLRSAGSLGTGDFANGKPGGLQGLQGVPVPPELVPVPGDVAIAVSNHVNLLIRAGA